MFLLQSIIMIIAIRLNF